MASVKNEFFVVASKSILNFSYEWKNGRMIDFVIKKMLEESQKGFKYFNKELGADGKTRHYFQCP